MCGTAACVSAASAQARASPLEADLLKIEILGVQLVDPDLLERMNRDLAPEPADPVGLHRGDVDVPHTVTLEIDERIGNAERDLVPQLG